MGAELSAEEHRSLIQVMQKISDDNWAYYQYRRNCEDSRELCRMMNKWPKSTVDDGKDIPEDELIRMLESSLGKVKEEEKNIKVFSSVGPALDSIKEREDRGLQISAEEKTEVVRKARDLGWAPS